MRASATRCASYLASALTDELRAAGRRCSGIFTDYPEGIRWHRTLAQRGWSVPQWPVEHGGTGWSPMQHYLFASELAAADAPPLAPMGTHMVGPVIIAFGTPEQQQQRWLPGIRSGEDYWAQGYSEPQAGSDLASLQCRAVRDGDEYVINGTKIWTTHAQFANKMFCLVRTGQSGKRQQGISFLCFDLQRPGITVRPIIGISGDHELNQVFLDDVRIIAAAAREAPAPARPRDRRHGGRPPAPGHPLQRRTQCAAVHRAASTHSDPIFDDCVQRLLDAAGPAAAPLVEADAPAAATADALQEPLTRKGIRVPQLLADGYSNSTMAVKLFVSDSTVRTNLRNINMKLRAKSRTQAVAIARRLAVIR